MSNFHRSVSVSLCALFLMASSVVDVDAAPFGQSKSSSSAPKPAPYSRSAPSAPTKVVAPQPQPRGSISSGSNMGMTRPAVTNAVRSGQPVASPTPYARPVSPPVPQNSNRVATPQGGYAPANSNTGQYAQPAKSGHSTGALVGAAAGAAAVGYMLGSSGDNTAQAQQAPAGQVQGQPIPTGQAVDPNLQQVQGQSPLASSAPVQQAPVPQEEGSSSLFWLILLGIAGVAVFWMLKKKPSRTNNSPYSQNHVVPPVTSPSVQPVSPVVPEPTIDPNVSLENEKEKLFRRIQENNRPSSLDIVRHATTPDLFQQISPLVEQSSDTRRVDIRDLTATIINVANEGGKILGSITYQANIVESDENRDTVVTPVHEIWHFELQKDQWKLAGIEQV